MSPSHSRQSDADLVAATLSGDDKAFGELVTRYQGAVFGCARAITRHDADAADAAQDAFIRFHRNLAQFDPARPIKPYLLTIAANCSRSLLAARCRQAAVPDGDEQLARIPDPTGGPATHLVRDERRSAVRSMVDALPQTLREVCSLFYLGGCSCREVACILRMNEGAVKTALHRARRKLHERGVGQWQIP